MARNILIVAVPLLIICLLIPVFAVSQKFQNILSSGTIKYASSFRIGEYTMSWNFGEYNGNASAIANTFDMSQSWWVGTPPGYGGYTATANEVHALNPNYKFLVYRNVMSIYSYWTDQWSYANSQGWLLKDANGNYITWTPTDYLVDITNSSYQQWLGSKVESWLQQYPFFDGVFADCSMFNSVGSWLYYANGTAINPSTGQPFTNQQIATGFAGCLNAIQTAIGPSKFVVSNGLCNGPTFYSGGYNPELSQVSNLTGIISENCFEGNPFYSESDWIQSVNMVEWIQNNFLSVNPNRKFVAVQYADNSSVPTLPPGVTREQLMLFGYCSLLLSAEFPEQNLISFGELATEPDLLAFAEQLRAINMIAPMNDYYEINSTSVYSRDFIAGKILVNPTNVTYSVQLDQGYTLLNGSIVSGSITVPPYTGILLFS